MYSIEHAKEPLSYTNTIYRACTRRLFILAVKLILELLVALMAVVTSYCETQQFLLHILLLHFPFCYSLAVSVLYRVIARCLCGIHAVYVFGVSVHVFLGSSPVFQL